MTSFYIFTSLFIFAKILSLTSQNFSPGGQPMLFYGIFQQCPTDQVVTNSKLCQSAVQHANRDKNKFWKFILEKGKFKINNLMNENDFLYIHETFCSQDEAAQIAINLKLNHYYRRICAYNGTKVALHAHEKSSRHNSRLSSVKYFLVRNSS